VARLRVRPLGAAVDAGGTRKASVWTVADVTRERERQENVFQELQHAIDYLDHAPAGFFLGRWQRRRRLQSMPRWRAGSIMISPRSAPGGSGWPISCPATVWRFLTALSGHPGEVKTEIFDLDLRRRDGRTLPVRLYHKIAFAADATAGASRHAGAQPPAAVPAPTRCAMPKSVSYASSITPRWR